MWGSRVPGRLAVSTATRVPTITPDGDKKGFKPPALDLSEGDQVGRIQGQCVLLWDSWVWALRFWSKRRNLGSDVT